MAATPKQLAALAKHRENQARLKKHREAQARAEQLKAVKTSHLGDCATRHDFDKKASAKTKRFVKLGNSGKIATFTRSSVCKRCGFSEAGRSWSETIWNKEANAYREGVLKRFPALRAAIEDRLAAV